MFEKHKQAKTDKLINMLDIQAISLKKKFDSINGWIELHIDSDPNLSEMITCICNYGELVAAYNHVYKKYNTYPIVERASDQLLNYEKVGYNSNIGLNIFKATHYAIPYINNTIKETTCSLKRMMELREDHELFRDGAVTTFLDPIYSSALCAEFAIENEKGSELRTKVLAKCGGIYNYIHQEKRNNKNFLYDNEVEFNQLKSDFQNYISVSKKQQFVSDIDNMIDKIDKNYLYSENEPKKIVYHAKKTFR